MVGIKEEGVGSSEIGLERANGSLLGFDLLVEVSSFNKNSGIKFLKVVVVEAEKVLSVVGSDVC